MKNILNVSEEVTEWEKIGVHLSVPPSELESIRTECGGDAKEAKSLLFQYWLGNDSHTSWQKLALAYTKSGYKSLSSKIASQDSGNEMFERLDQSGYNSDSIPIGWNVRLQRNENVNIVFHSLYGLSIHIYIFVSG